MEKFCAVSSPLTVEMDRPSIICTRKSEISPSICAFSLPLSRSSSIFFVCSRSDSRLCCSFSSEPSGSVMMSPRISPMSASFSLSYSSFRFL